MIAWKGHQSSKAAQTARDHSQVPTPFYHLSVARELLQNPQLKNPARRRLAAERCAFLFGNTAPDVQVVSGQPRQETHFFTLPITGESQPAWELFRTSYQQFFETKSLKPGQAAFIAGYICHLQADWYWIERIFQPFFGQSCTWVNSKSRLYLHNVLRAYLDAEALRTLPTGINECLKHVQPEQWLPFIRDEHLHEWGSFLAQQLHPNGKTRTVEVFAEREGLDPENFTSLLKSEKRMDQEIFIHISQNLLIEYRQDLIVTSLSFLNEFLA